MGETIYSELIRYVQKNDYAKIIKTVNKVLHTNHDDIKAFHCKIVALINLDKFEDALIAFNKFPDFTKHLLFEKAYCLYRLNKMDDALKVIESSPDKNKQNFRELSAQIAYRQERFEDSYSLYSTLVKQVADEFDDERKTNFIANVAYLVKIGKGIDISSICSDKSSTDSYEILFNTACYLMHAKKYYDAESYLSIAEKRCIESFDEDTPQSEVDSELNVIKTQLACCKHFQRKESQAVNIYKGILDKKPSDYGVIAVATNNSLAVNKKKNVFEMKKRMKALQSETLMSKLTSSQRRAIFINLFQINALNVLTADEALNTCDKLIIEYPDSLETLVLIKAAILMKNKNLECAITVLEEYLKSSTGSKLKMGLAIAQFYLNMGKYQKASETLKSLGEDVYHPGLVSTLVTILIALKDSAGASKILDSAVEWNKKAKDSGNTRELKALYDHAADLHLKRGQPKHAVDSLEELLKLKPNDIKVLSKLTIAYTKINPSKAYGLCERIRSNATLNPHLDANSLESSSWMMGLKAIKKVTRVQSPGTPFLSKNKKCHNPKKKKRLPKNYDPSIPPDPERWLPKRERSNYKRKKDRRNKDIGKGTQGASSSASDQYDITKMSSNSKDKIVQPAVDDHKHQQRKMQQRKKKKGGKW